MASMTDNVIDLMTRKIQKLPPSTQQVLTLAACIGNPFDPGSLAVVSQQSFDGVVTNLQDALAAGLIQAVEAPLDTRTPGSADAEMTTVPAYVFLHDRIQQAAYGLIPAEKLPSVHLTSGRLLLERHVGRTYTTPSFSK